MKRSACAVLVALALFHHASTDAAEAPAFWSNSPEVIDSSREVLPASYRTLRIDTEAFKEHLLSVPHERDVHIRDSSFVITMPLPDGSMHRFRIVEAPVMAPALSKKFPDIRSYAGQGIDDPTATLRFDVSPKGFHGAVISAKGSYFIDPYSKDSVDTYLSYWEEEFYKTNTKVFREMPLIQEDDPTDPKFHRGIRRKDASRAEPSKVGVTHQKTSSGTQLRTYRLALAATGEYTAFHGGTVADALAAMNATLVRVNGVFEREVAIRLELIGNTDLLIYTSPDTDPYTNDDQSALLAENQANADAVIGTANYDIGHVFSTGGGGLAQIAQVCRDGWKGSGTSQLYEVSGAGDPFDINVVAHEFGHQFGANHSFNNACEANGRIVRSESAAYEPGAGSTIMSYANVCPPLPDVQSYPDDYFNNHSFNEIIDYSVRGNGDWLEAPERVSAGYFHSCALGATGVAC